MQVDLPPVLSSSTVARVAGSTGATTLLHEVYLDMAGRPLAP